jgi:hypothetical protein
MKNAKQITEIVQSEHSWNFFVRSKLFMHTVPNEAVLNQAVTDQFKTSQW